MAYNKAKDGHVKHSKRINKISLSLALNQRWKCTRIPETGAHSLVVLAAISFPHNFGVCHFSREMTTVVPSYEYRCILNFLCAGWNVCRSTIFMTSFFVEEKKVEEIQSWAKRNIRFEMRPMRRKWERAQRKKKRNKSNMTINMYVANMGLKLLSRAVKYSTDTNTHTARVEVVMWTDGAPSCLPLPHAHTHK